MPELLDSEKGRPRYEARQHAIVLLLRKPHRRYVILVTVLAVLAWLGPWQFGLLLALVVIALAYARFRLWEAERIVLTHKRIIHVQGILETTRTEASLRLDRISGLQLVETAPGRLLGYASISVEAPGDHPGLKRLYRISNPIPFYNRLRGVVFGEQKALDPDDGPVESTGDYVTEELPHLDDRPRFRRR